jgi:hypothetical protein
MNNSAAALAQRWRIEDVDRLIVTGWSPAHGLATLILTGNLADRVAPDPAAIAQHLTNGLIALAQVQVTTTRNNQ